jgi:hypothetical protein
MTKKVNGIPAAEKIKNAIEKSVRYWDFLIVHVIK